MPILTAIRKLMPTIVLLSVIQILILPTALIWEQSTKPLIFPLFSMVLQVKTHLIFRSGGLILRLVLSPVAEAKERYMKAGCLMAADLMQKHQYRRLPAAPALVVVLQ